MTQDIEKYVEEFAKTFVNQIKTVKIGQYDESGKNIGFKTAYNLMQDWLRTNLTKVAEEVRREERERLGRRLPENTISITLEARKYCRVLANTKLVSYEETMLSGGMALRFEADEAINQMLQSLANLSDK